MPAVNREFLFQDMGAMSRVFVEMSWRRGLGAQMPRSGTRHPTPKKRAGRSTQAEARRGRAGAMGSVAVVHTLRSCGTEKCPCYFATDGASLGSEKKAEK